MIVSKFRWRDEEGRWRRLFLGFPRKGTDRLSAHVYSHMEILIGYDSFKVSMSCIFNICCIGAWGLFYFSYAATARGPVFRVCTIE
jgi:hypothetical protein